MHRTRTRLFATLTIAAACCAAPLQAQAWHYAAFQTADVATPEANFILSGFGDYGMTFVGQYRFTADKRTQIWFDAGLATPTGTTLFLVGAAAGWNVIKPTPDKPIDVMPTVGVYGAFGSDFSYVRLPLGVDVGHTFKLDNAHAIQAFAYPRVSIDFCTSGTCSGTHGALNFDLGAAYDITKAMSGRAAFTFGAVGADDSQAGFGISLAIKTGGKN